MTRIKKVNNPAYVSDGTNVVVQATIILTHRDIML
jgi:hypothetical protein